MTKDEKLAEFIGFDILSNGYYQFEGEITRSLPDFKNSWDWMMKVVEQIETVEDNTYIVEISDCMCQITGFETDNDPGIYCCGGNKKESVYDACYLFVEFYKNIKK